MKIGNIVESIVENSEKVNIVEFRYFLYPMKRITKKLTSSHKQCIYIYMTNKSASMLIFNFRVNLTVKKFLISFINYFSNYSMQRTKKILITVNGDQPKG